jgi:membrane-associated phospholipid phosphatase
MQTSTAAPEARWPARCTQRLLHLWFFKAAGTAAFMGIFFYSYFAVLRSPVRPVTTMPTTWLDDGITFWPPAFYLYASLWVYTSLVPALQPSLLRLVAYGCGIGALCLTGLVIFTLFPTSVPFGFADWLVDPSLSLLRSLDMGGNACPSLHVATALFSAVCLRSLLQGLGAPRWVGLVNWIWCALIVYSTMAVKQHVFWDVVAGAALAAVFALLYPQLEQRLVEPAAPAKKT